jgi:hypothetical protein
MTKQSQKGSIQSAAAVFLRQLEAHFERAVIGHKAPEEEIGNAPPALKLELHAAEEFLSQLLTHFEGDRPDVRELEAEEEK